MNGLPKAVTPQDVCEAEAEIAQRRVMALLPHVEAINEMLLSQSAVKKIDRPNVDAEQEKLLRAHFKEWDIRAVTEERGLQWNPCPVVVWVFTPTARRGAK